jgi:hypothetical protein
MSIKLSKPAFVQISANAMTPTKIERLIPNFQTLFGFKEIIQKSTAIEQPHTIEIGKLVRQGYVQGWANDESGNRIDGYAFECEIEDMDGKNILKEIHLDLLGNLQLLNESIEFELSSAFKN